MQPLFFPMHTYFVDTESLSMDMVDSILCPYFHKAHKTSHRQLSWLGDNQDKTITWILTATKSKLRYVDRKSVV